MAQIKKIVRSNPLSTFQNTRPSAGGGFELLALAMDEIYKRAAPAAVEQMKAEGAEYGRERAKSDLANTGQTYSGGAGKTQIKGGASDDKLRGVRADLVEIVNEAAARVGLKIGYSEGLRSKERQKDLVAAGKSQTMNSKHLHGNALDIHILNPDGTANWDFEAYRPLAAAAKQIAKERGLKNFVWGGDWKSLRDGVHFQLTDPSDTIQGGASTDTLQGGVMEDELEDPASAGQTGGAAAGGVIAPPVAIQNKDGGLELRKYSPFAGPILQAHDAAAKVAYLAEAENTALAQLQTMSREFEFDVEGFRDAAQGYIDEITKSAPPELKSFLRAGLNEAAQRRMGGIQDAALKNVRARANASSRALMERHSDALAEAIASGDEATIEAARSRLQGVLTARERLPGVIWTPEQSENVMIKAQRRAEQITSVSRSTRNKDQADKLRAVIRGAKKGIVMDEEEILKDPEALANHPDLAAEAAALVAWREASPGFEAMPPDMMDAEITTMEEDGIPESMISVVEAARKVAKEARGAWEKDAVSAAGEYLVGSPIGPPPPLNLAEIDAENPEQIIKSIAARRAYMDRVADLGFTDAPNYLSEDEAEALSVILDKGTDPAMKAAVAGVLVAGFGNAAPKALDEIGGDKATMLAGKMMAFGEKRTATEIFRGQQAISENMVQIPSKAKRITAYSRIAGAFDGIPNGEAMSADIMDAATAIYAARAQGVDPNSEAGAALMEESIQAALGQRTNRKGETTGGAQEVNGYMTLLPMGMTAEAAETSLSAALPKGAMQIQPYHFLTPGRIVTDSARRFFERNNEAPDFEGVWKSAGATSAPHFNGKPLDHNMIDAEMLRIVPDKGGRYRIEVTVGSQTWPAVDAAGDYFFFDLNKLSEASQ